MLLLIDADGNDVRLIQQNIRRHQHGVIHQTHIDIIRMAGAFILELGHAGKFARVRDGI